MNHLHQPHPDADLVSRQVATLDHTPSAPPTLLPGGALMGLESGVTRFAPRLRDTDWIKAGEKLSKLQTFWNLRAQRIPVGDACHMVGLSRVDLCRWGKRLEAANLTPESDPNALRLALLDKKSPGRPCEWEYLLKQLDVRTFLESAYLSTMGASHEAAARDRRTGQISLTLEWFADSPLCPARLGERLRKGYQPASVVRFLQRRFTPEIEAMVRGSKNFLHNGLVSRRGHTVAGPDGQLYALPAGFIIEFDDMSSNTPFYVQNADGSFTLSRQGLYARDVQSGRRLAVELIARPREAYRAADILRFLMKLTQDYGKPTVIRLEKGIWKSRIIYGFAITNTGALLEEDWMRPAADPEEQPLLHRGLEAAGIKIEYVVGSHAKGGVESSFRRLQDAIALHTQEFVNLGRHAGEFERNALALRRARAESHTPDQLGIAPLDVLADRVAAAMGWLNAKSKTGPSPDEKWLTGTAARPLPKPTLLDTAFMMPDQRTLTVAGGRITATVSGQPLDFRAPALFATLGDGAKVTIRFDSLQPHLSAAVFNDRGQFLDWATYEPPGPGYRAKDAALVAGLEAIDMAPYGPNRNIGWHLRKQQQDFLSAAYRSLPRPGQPAVKGTFQHPPAPQTTVEVHPPQTPDPKTQTPSPRRLSAAAQLLAAGDAPTEFPESAEASWA